MWTAPPPRVKICCIADEEEAALALRYGAAAIGLVAAMPSGPGQIAESTIGTIATSLPPDVQTFLLTSETDPARIVQQHRRCRTTTIQIVDRLAPGAHAHLRRDLPGVTLVQVIHVTGPQAIDAAAAVAGDIDAILLDTGSPDAPRRELGGTGRVHDWSISRRIRESVQVPVLLAGGLRPENVAQAIRTVGPYAVDICSGVRSGGRLDEAKLAAFMDQVRAETATAGGSSRD